MTIRMQLFAAVAGAALLLPGCFSYPLPVKQYGIKQEAPVMKSTKKPITSPATSRRSKAGAMSSESVEVKALKIENQDLGKRMDLLEQRLREMERKNKITQ